MDKYKKRLKVMSKLEKVLLCFLVITIFAFLIESTISASLRSDLTDSQNEVTDLTDQISVVEDKLTESEKVINKLKNPDVTETIVIPETKDKYEDVKDGNDVTLGYGTFTVGDDIEPGTYSVTPIAGYDTMVVNGLLGGSNYRHTFGFNQFDEGAARTVKNIDLISGETIELDDVEVEFEANTSEELVQEGRAESTETMTKTYNDDGEVIYVCTKDDESTDCEELEKYDALKQKVDK